MNYTGYEATKSVANFMYRVYGWMAAGLAITAATAYTVYSIPAVMKTIFSNPFLPMFLLICQLGMVISLSGFITRMSLTTATAVYLGYSLLTGVTLSSIFIVYKLASIYTAFAVASGMFSVMALYGYMTGDDLTGVGSIARMGLVGIIIAMLVNFFVGSAQMEYIISLIGVGVFTLLTAHDSQKIKQMGSVMVYQQNEEVGKVALLGALTLYLDFINLFLFLLRLFGQQRNND